MFEKKDLKNTSKSHAHRWRTEKKWLNTYVLKPKKFHYYIGVSSTENSSKGVFFKKIENINALKKRQALVFSKSPESNSSFYWRAKEWKR